MDEIFEIARGGSPRPIKNYITNDKNGINWISIKDASNSTKYIEKTKNKITKEGLKKSRMVYPGDFLLTNSMSFGRPYIMRTSGCIHDGWLVLKPKLKNIDTDYFYHLLGSESVYNHFSKVVAGAVVKNLNIDLVKALKIPLPPLDEQKRIATILDKADAIRCKRQQAIKLADEFLRAIFLDMFGDPIINSMGWPEESWANVLKIVNGKNQKNVKEEYGIYPIYGSGGEMGRANDYLCYENTVIIGRKGNINKPILVSEKFWNVDTAFGLEADSNKLSYLYLFWFCRFFNFEKLNKTVTIPSLTKSDLLDIKIPVPDIKYQKKFEIAHHAIDNIINNFEASTESISELFSSISQKAFAGEL